MKKITVTLTEDQAFSVKQVLGWSRSEGLEKWSESKQEFVLYRNPEEIKYDAFLQRIVDKIIKAESLIN